MIYNFLHRFTVIYFFISYLLLTSCSKHDTPGMPPTQPDKKALDVELKCILPAVLKETSGLCYTENSIWSFGDGGNPSAIYKIDSTSGAILQTVIIVNYPNIDWEDITSDSLYLYIEDMGNNDGNRKDLKILRINKTDLIAGPSSINVTAEAINFSYADQFDFTSNNNTNFDCEALVAVQNYLYAFTKDGGDLKTRCYKIPKIPGTYSISPISSFNVDGKITAAAYNSATGELALLGYMNKKIGSFIYFFNDYQNDDFFAGSAARVSIGSLTIDWQTEGLDYISNNRLLMSCETSNSHLASLYSVQKN